MPKRYASRKRTYRKKSRKITRFRRYRTGTRAKAKSYFRLRRAAKNYSKTRKIKRAKRQYKYTAGKGVKNKIKHLTMSEFALLPVYDLARISGCVVSNHFPNMYTDLTQELRRQFNAAYVKYWYKFGAILPEKIFNTTSPYIVGSNKNYPPYLYAYNPILSPVTCGSKMQLYAAMYKKFKYVGIKVTWHPKARSVSTVIPSKTTTTSAKKDDGSSYKMRFDTATVTPAGPIIPSPFSNASTNALQLDPTTYKQETEVTSVTSTSAPTLYMHVYFGKQLEHIESWNLPYFHKTLVQDPTTKEPVNHYTLPNVIYGHDDTRRLKAAPFYDYNTMLPCIDRDSKLHKVYDMSRPFSFFVRPMVSTNTVTKEAPTKETEEVHNFDVNVAEDIETLQKGLKHLGYRDFTHALTPKQLEIPQDGYAIEHVKDENDPYYNRWSQLSNDNNFFNPIMFWYCFTTSESFIFSLEDSADSKNPHQLFSEVVINADLDGIPNSNAKAELSAHPSTQSDFLNNYGYFDVTFYTKWKEERPMVSKTSYVGIVPSETGVEGLSSIIAPNNN